MKDRIPTYPGRVTITPENGTAYTATIARNDDPTQVGTPLNTATLLSDTTAANLGLTGDNATPNKAFGALTPKIGDIKETVRTDLGANWLECNGASVNATDYPDLVPMLEDDITAWKKVNTTNTYPSAYAYGNGYYVYTNETANYYYATDINGPWTAVTAAFSCTGVSFINGKFLMTTSTSSNVRVYYATDPTSWSNFTQSGAAVSSQYGAPVVYDGERYFIATRYSTTAYLYYTTSLDNETWTRDSVTSCSEYCRPRFHFMNGKYFLVAYNSNYGFFIMKDSFSGSWTQKNPKTSGGSSIPQFDISFFNGTYILLSAMSGAQFLYSTDLSTWTRNSTINTYLEYPVIKDGVIYFFASSSQDKEYKIFYGTDILDLRETSAQVAFSSVENVNGRFITYSQRQLGSTDDRGIYVTDASLGVLPNIQPSGAKAYIKAK